MTRLRQYLFQGLFIALAFTALADPIPFKRMLDDPLKFHGYQGASPDPTGLDTVDIGLFLPGEESTPLARDLLNGIELAIDEANRNGGFNGVPFRTIRRWADNPWGAGSKEVIRLVYQDQVRAIIGFVNGPGHIAQQIAAKAYITVISPISSDPTLTQARLPWIFRLPPDSASQAKVLVTEGLSQRRINKLGLITSSDHDGRIAAAELRSSLQSSDKALLFHLTLAPQAETVSQIIDRLKEFSPEGLLLHLTPEMIMQFAAGLNRQGLSYPLFIPWLPGLSLTELKSVYPEEVVTLAPFAQPTTEAFKHFSQAYTKRFSTYATPSAAYGYDAVQLIISAIRTKGLNRSAIRDGIAAQSDFQGVSGPIAWDHGGGNKGRAVLKIFAK